MTAIPLPPGRAGLRWGIYDRISGKQGTKIGDADEDTASLETQDERNRALIAAIDPTGTIVEAHVYREIHTATELFTRPKLTLLREAMRRHEIDAIACYQPKRWARDEDHAGYLKTELREYGVILRYAEDDPGDGDAGAIMGYFQHWAGRQEHKTINEQTHRARAKLVHLGRAWAGSKPPYGFRWRYETITHPDGRLEQRRIGWRVEPTEARIVRELFRDFLRGASLRGLALRLSERAIPSPTGLPSWTDKTIRYLLQSRHYTGEAFGLRHERDKTRPRIGTRGKSAGRPRYPDRIRPEDEWVKLPDGYAPQLVSQDTFEAAGARLAQLGRGGSHPSQTAQQTLMGGGRARCAECGNTLSRLGATRLALICSGRAMKKCKTRPSIRMATLDDAVKRLARWIYEHPEALAEQAELHRQDDPTEADLAMVEQTLADIGRRQAGVALVAADVTDAEAAAPLVASLKALAEQKKQADADRADLLAKRQGWEDVQRFLRGFTQLAGRVSPRLDRFSHADWQQAIDALEITATVYPASAPQRYRLQTRMAGVVTLPLLVELGGAAGAASEVWSEQAVCVERSAPASTAHDAHLTLIWSQAQVAALPALQHPAQAPARAASPTSPTRAAVARPA